MSRYVKAPAGIPGSMCIIGRNIKSIYAGFVQITKSKKALDKGVSLC
jgi:hypothetical protein